MLLLAADPSPSVRFAAALDAAGRRSMEAPLASSGDPRVRFALTTAYDRDPVEQLRRTTQEVLARDRSALIRGRLAQSTAHRDLYERLLRDPNPRARYDAAGNPRATRADIGGLLADLDPVVRRGAVSHGIDYPDEAQLLHAGSDPSADVREAVLLRPAIPLSIAQALVEDADPQVRGRARELVSDPDLIYPIPLGAGILAGRYAWLTSTSATPHR